MIKLGKEKKLIFYEFVGTEMDNATYDMLKKYAMEKILSDDNALVNYAFNRILVEQMNRDRAARKTAAKSKTLSKATRKPRKV
jgi:hypothetical protein